MGFTYDSLMSYKIPEVRQRLTPRDAVFYALSVGFGQDPLNPRQLDFVDVHRRLRAAPTQSVVLGHPGFWMADPKQESTPCASFMANSASSCAARCRSMAR
jgi:hypothetical protein